MTQINFKKLENLLKMSTAADGFTTTDAAIRSPTFTALPSPSPPDSQLITDSETFERIICWPDMILLRNMSMRLNFTHSVCNTFFPLWGKIQSNTAVEFVQYWATLMFSLVIASGTCDINFTNIEDAFNSNRGIDCVFTGATFVFDAIRWTWGNMFGGTIRAPSCQQSHATQWLISSCFQSIEVLVFVAILETWSFHSLVISLGRSSSQSNLVSHNLSWIFFQGLLLAVVKGSKSFATVDAVILNMNVPLRGCHSKPNVFTLSAGIHRRR